MCDAPTRGAAARERRTPAMPAEPERAAVRKFRDNAYRTWLEDEKPGARPPAGVAEWQTQRTQNPPLATA